MFDTFKLKNPNTNNNSTMFVVKYDSSGNVKWAKTCGGNSTNSANSLAADSSGNIYVIGSFGIDSIIIGNVTIKTTPKSIGSDVFIAKYDSLGNVKWVNSFGGNDCDKGMSICTDKLGNVYGTAWIVSDSIQIGKHILYSKKKSVTIIFGYNSIGKPIWSKAAAGNSINQATSIVAGNENNIYLTGTFTADSIMFDNYKLYNKYQLEDIFVVKLNFNGTTIWAKGYGSSGSDISQSVYLDATGNVYITGYYNSSLLNFDKISLTNNASGYNDIFATSLDANGNVLWAKSYGGLNEDYSNAITVDNLNNIYLTGNFNSNTINFDNINLKNNGKSDYFITQLSSQMQSVSKNEHNSMTIYPNPSSEAININTSLFSGNNPVIVIIRNINGKEVIKQTIKKNQPISIAELSKGVYIIELKNNNSFYYKLIKN